MNSYDMFKNMLCFANAMVDAYKLTNADSPEEALLKLHIYNNEDLAQKIETGLDSIEKNENEINRSVEKSKA